jgi:GcrA cell cycle regulator
MEQNVMGATWTKERIADLRRMVSEGVPFSQIADKLGTTKNACSGKADRLGLSAKSERAVRLKIRGGHGAFGVSLESQNAPSLPSMPDGSNTPTKQRCTLLQLSNDVCKWPFGEPQSPDFFFCGGKAMDGFPYCAQHCRLAYKARAA